MPSPLRFLLAGLLTAQSAWAQTTEEVLRATDAFALAIAHFDPDHVADIRDDSWQVAFVRTALDAVSSAVPETSDIHVLGGGRPDLFSRGISVTRVISAEGEARADSIRAAWDTLTGACGREPDSRRESQGGQTPIRWVREFGQAGCESEVAQRVVKAGVWRATLEEEVLSLSRVLRVRMTLHLVGPPRDAVAVVQSLGEAYPSFAGHIGLFRAQTWRADWDGSRLRLVSDGEAADPDWPIQFHFAKRWGDCPSGCINEHWWRIRATPVEQEQGWDFEVEVISEGGDPLPAPAV